MFPLAWATLLASSYAWSQSYEAFPTVSLTIPTQQLITGVSDLSFGSYSGSGAFTKSDTVCVYNNSANGHYDVKIRGNGTSSAFTVTDGTHTLPYSVYWQDSSQKAQVQNPNDTLSGRLGASSSQTCNSGTNATFEVEFSAVELMKVPAGHYTGRLYIAIMAPSS